MNVVNNIDNISGMKQTDDLFYDLAFADPPYGIDGNSHRRNKSRANATRSKNYHTELWNQGKPTNEFFEQLKRVSKDYFIFGANYFEQITEPFKTPRKEFINDFLQQYPTNWI